MKYIQLIVVLLLCWVISTNSSVRISVDYSPAYAGLFEHNRLRKIHGVAPLKLNDDLSLRSTEYAKILAEKQNLLHSQSDGLYGENLCIDSRKPERCVQIWYDENIYYDYSNPRFTFETGHFTQVIWVGTTEMGWGQAQDAYGTYYVVVMYTPAGNIKGEFAKNVPVPVSYLNAAFGKNSVSINAMIISIFFGLLNLTN